MELSSLGGGGDVTDSSELEAEDEDRGAAPHILAALLQLPLFDELFLRMQATNVSLVDGMIEPMETDLLHELIELERTPVPSAMMVSAISQMWMFGVYELLRTWRQRVNGLLKIHRELAEALAHERVAALTRKADEVRSSREDANPALGIHRASILRLADSDFVASLERALVVVEPVFRRIESLRVTLAKHEVPRGAGRIAVAPGYGRIDYLTGSMYWQVDLKDDTVDIVNRRAIADDLRRLRP